MNIWKISLENIKSKSLYTLLSILVLSLSITLLLGIQQLKNSFEYQIANNLGDIDLVLGAKGSPLQLVLASVLFVDNPTGNIPYKEAKKIAKNRFVKKAVPISYGDNYKGYRIVGTTPEFLTFYKAELETGQTFKKSMEVVLGNEIAKKLNLTIGDTFVSSHGLVDNDIHVHEDKLTVVGILHPTQKVIDRLVVTSLESIWDVHNEHAHVENNETEHDATEHNNDKEITSLLISFRNPTALLTLPRRINKDTPMQAVLPKFELTKLYEYTGIGIKTITWIAYLIMMISGITIFISIYKMIKERAFEIAMLRTYGASHVQLIKMVVYEGFTIVFSSFVVGFTLTKIGIGAIMNYLDSSNQILIQGLELNQILQLMGWVLVMLFLSILLAIYPIIKMNISTILSNEK